MTSNQRKEKLTKGTAKVNKEAKKYSQASIISTNASY